MFSNEMSIAVTVSDGKKTADWFREKVGLKSSAEGHWVLVWPEGSTVKVHLCQGKLDPGNTGIAFYVPDVAAKEAEMKKKGVKFTMPTKKEAWGTNAMFADPDGNEYWLSEGTGP
jgi:predicted enzyme related to lactoylglutathione lyase